MKALRLISNSNYIEHTEPICKKNTIAKAHLDMSSIAVWKFYYKLMNNQLPISLNGGQNCLKCVHAMKSKALYFIYKYLNINLQNTHFDTV